MGVITDHVESEFFLLKQDEQVALARLKTSLSRREHEGGRLTDYVLDPRAVLAATDLAVALAATGFETQRDDAGNLVSLVWTAEQLPYGADELKRVFETFGRFVRRGSFLRLDEQGDEFALRFDGARVILEIDGEVPEPHDALRDDAARAAEDGRDDDLLDLCVLLIESSGATDRQRQWAWDKRLAVIRGGRRWSEFVQACRSAPTDMVSVEAWANELEESEPSVAAELRRAPNTGGTPPQRD